MPTVGQKRRKRNDNKSCNCRSARPNGKRGVNAIMKAPNMEMVAALDYKYEGQYLHGTEVNDDPSGIPIYTSLEKLGSCQQARCTS